MTLKATGRVVVLVVAAGVGCGRTVLVAPGTAVEPQSDAAISTVESGSSSGGAMSGEGGAPDATLDSGSSDGGSEDSSLGVAVDASPESSGSGASEPPSCAPGGLGITNCGSAGESCCKSLEVPGGTFYRTYDPLDSNGVIQLGVDGGATGEADPATVSGFRLDKYLVTVGRFRQFEYAWIQGWRPPAGTGKHAHLNGGQGLVNVGVEAGLVYETGWVASDDGNVQPTDANLQCDPATDATWTASPGSHENLPIACENWWEAYAFCIWDDGFLPSEAEWEYATAGGSQQREYPWGSAAPGTASKYAIYDCDYKGSGPLTCMTNDFNIAPVGSATAGAGLWGQLDLAGEVWEWNLDWHVAYVDPCVDCAYLTTASFRAAHGGDYSRELIVPSERNSFSPSDRSVNLGLRCGRAP